jgi:hypothetical protein
MTGTSQTQVAEHILPRHALTRVSRRSVIDVSRRAIPWRWTSVLLAPVELLALVWSVPIVVLLVMLPIGLALAGVLWLGRIILTVF